MNELYAVDPSAPEDIKDLVALFGSFGLRNGRFIAEFPNTWLDMLGKKIDLLSDLDRARFSRLRALHSDVVLPLRDDRVQYRHSRTWLENAISLKTNAGLVKEVLAVDPNPLNVATLNDYLWERGEKASLHRGAHVSMTADEYARAVAPLFAHSTEVHLADPYFALRRETGFLDRQRCDALQALTAAAAASRRCETFVLHLNLGNKALTSENKARLQEDIAETVASNAGSKLRILFKYHNRMTHGRYIFSQKGGLQFDHGFILMSGKKNHVHWLGDAELEPLIKDYLDGFAVVRRGATNTS